MERIKSLTAVISFEEKYCFVVQDCKFLSIYSASFNMRNEWNNKFCRLGEKACNVTLHPTTINWKVWTNSKNEIIFLKDAEKACSKRK